MKRFTARRVLKGLCFRLVVVYVILYSPHRLIAQDTGYPQSWGRWKTRITLTAAYLGPNALPVPEIRKGYISPNLSLEFSGHSHSSDFDKTYNTFAKLSIPVAPGRVSLEVWGAIFEYFETDTLSLISRLAWTQNPTGKSYGDLYLSTLIQIVKDHHYLPDIIVTLNLKTASGNNLEALRHTDTPGYYFDLSAGKTFSILNNLDVRPYGLAGFYVYQTHQVMNLQNDAFLWGAGMEFALPKLEFNLRIGGYYGYFDQGDRPIVARFTNYIYFGRVISGVWGLQFGLKDFEYNSIYFGVRATLPSSAISTRITTN